MSTYTVTSDLTRVTTKTRSTLVLLLALTGALWLALLVFAPAAHAVCPNPLCTNGDTGGGGGGSGGGGGGPVPPPTGGGGTGSPPPPPSVFESVRSDWSSRNYYYFPEAIPDIAAPSGEGGSAGAVGVSASYGGQCDGRALGVRTDQGGYTQSLEGGGELIVQTYAYYTCISTFVDTPIRCADYVGADGWGPYENPTFAATQFYSSGPFPSPFAASGYTNADLCGRGFVQDFEADMKEYGKYRLVANGWQTQCTQRRYTSADPRIGGTRATEIYGCFGRFPYSVNEVRAQLFCESPGFALNWSDHSPYTTERCKNVEPSKYRCDYEKAQPSYDAKGNNVAVLDDGRPRGAVWKSPFISGSGVRAVTGTEVRLDVKTSSTPYRTGTSPNSNTQPFKSAKTMNGWFGEPWQQAGHKTTFPLGFYQAGFPGKKWIATPSWRFDAEFLFTETTIKSVDWRTGNMTTASRNVWKPMLNNGCDGSPVNLDVFRARNTSN